VVLTKGDEYPIHQTPEPIAFSGTDRNFYDRYFFCGYLPDGDGYFALAFGIYPHLNIADAHFSVLRGGTQHCLHASRLLNMERMNLAVGPIRIEVLEPLHALRICVDGEGIRADLRCAGRAFPVQEPRFTRRLGPRVLMDLTRFTQNVRWSGDVSVDGAAVMYEDAPGTRDRSWGVRPIGAPETQPVVPQQMPQFYWLWAPTNFPNLSLFFHVNEDEAGAPWNTRCVLAPDGAPAERQLHLVNPKMHMAWRAGQRRASAARLDVTDPSGRAHVVSYRPLATFLMKGIGYGHPEWAHGLWKGEHAQAREDFAPDSLDPLVLPHLHVQAICAARHDGAGAGSDGVGIVEQLVIGPHAPSGFASIIDGAKAEA
jgi:hypothetical protein